MKSAAEKGAADDWKIVKVKKSKKGKKQSNQDLHANEKSTTSNTKLCSLRLDENFNRKDIDRHIAAVRRSAFFLRLKDVIDQERLSTSMQIVTIVALGVGNFTKSKTSIVQFAVLKCLQEYFAAALSTATNKLTADLTCTQRVLSVTLFDPILTDAEKALCRDYGIEVDETNMKGKVAANKDSLFYMPHCPYRLYCNVLWTNWHQLQHLCVIGNRY